ncbi:MAG: EndoU domain-containing protein [Chitinophagaceae bacterium]|nr:EndoU domain-containing protein [Chitinophagaceae bacterium]
MSETIKNIKLSPEEFSQQLREVMTHMTTGEIKKGKSYGIHFFKTSHHRIGELIRPANAKGVWEARIDVRHPKTNAWVSKKKSSTLFPVSWTETILLQKIAEAYENSFLNNSFKKIGSTSCGIRIAFIFQQGVLASCYPLYD